MSVVPKSIVERIQFFENHIAPFTTNATAIGLLSAEVTDLTTKTTAARAAYDERQALIQAAEAATLAQRDAVDAMTVAGSALIDKVRAKAKQVGGNSVYTLAEIPAPATPTNVGNPGLPTGMKVTLKPNGSIELGWECVNPSGCNNVIYQIYRKTDSTGAYEYLGGCGERKFVDLTVPQGVPSVMYQIQGTRSTGVGDAAEFIVNFGTTPSGTTTATVATATGQPVKIAA